jgi:hypothetical protein
MYYVILQFLLLLIIRKRKKKRLEKTVKNTSGFSRFLPVVLTTRSYPQNLEELNMIFVFKICYIKAYFYITNNVLVLI